MKIRYEIEYDRNLYKKETDNGIKKSSFHFKNFNMYSKNYEIKTLYTYVYITDTTIY